MSLIHEEIITDNKVEFIEKVKNISLVLGFDPNWLMHVMYSESRLNHLAVNSKSGATGLIQFMPDTATALGTSTWALKQMSNVEQLDFVYLYLAPYKNKIKSYVDLYFAVFFPIAIGKPADWILKASNLSSSIIAQQNPIFDLNKDGVLTIDEVQNAMLTYIPDSFKNIFKKKT